MTIRGPLDIEPPIKSIVDTFIFGCGLIVKRLQIIHKHNGLPFCFERNILDRFQEHKKVFRSNIR